MADDAGFREVFRGDLSTVEMAAAILEEAGIESHRRWEQAGGVQFSASETAMIPGREAVLLVPSIAYDEAWEALARFQHPEPDQITELSSELAENRRKRRGFAAVILVILFAPLIIAVVALLVVLVGALFR
jgi:hypothetical protein